MVSSQAAIQRRSQSGARPINLARDMRGVLALLDVVFGPGLDAEGRRLLMNSLSLAGNTAPLFLRLSQAAGGLPPGFVWEDQGRIVGNVSLLTTPVPNRYIVANVAVHPDHRRKGVGRLLMQETIGALQRRGGQVIMLQVERENRQALNLYRSLGFNPVGAMTSWELSYSSLPATVAQNRQEKDEWPRIRLLGRREWRSAYFLDRASLHPDLNWPEPLSATAYRLGFWRLLDDFLNGRQSETWVTDGESAQGYTLTALARIKSEWGRPHNLALRVSPAWRGRLEGHMLAKMLRRLRYLPRRPIRLEHPADDEVANQLLKEARFSIRRTLTSMRLDLER